MKLGKYGTLLWYKAEKNVSDVTSHQGLWWTFGLKDIQEDASSILAYFVQIYIPNS